MTRIDRALMQQCILLLTLLIGLTFLPRAYAINSGNEDLKQQRQAYTKSLQLARKGDWKSLRKQRQSLVEYPLYPYLLYADLIAGMRYSRRAEVRNYLTHYAGTLKAAYLQGRWLDYLVRHRHWQSYVDFYSLNSYATNNANTSRQCHFHLSQYRLGEKIEALQAGLLLWTEGKSQPKTCDKLFGLLIRGGHISEARAWERFNKAMISHNYQLARYLRRFFTSPHYQKRYNTYYNVDRLPTRVSQYEAFTERSPDEHNILEHGLKHLARKDPASALKHWNHYQKTHEFSHIAQANIVSAIIKGLYKDGRQASADGYFVKHLDLLNQSLDGALTEWRIREALRDLDWPAVKRWIARLPQANKEKNNWRYWAIRTMEELPATESTANLMALTRALAMERDFYGFLASDKLAQEYNLNYQPVDVAEAHVLNLSRQPAMQRARELLFHGLSLDASREWRSATANFTTEDWLAAAVLANRWQWHSKAIASLGTVKQWDDIQIRFPLAYVAQINSAAEKTKIPAYMLFALARQESGFNATATSPAGAMGLIQVMPATAKETSRKYKIPYHNKRQLHDVNTNVPIGAHYYKGLIKRFGNNRILATAAYNAGPHRVSRWQKDSAGKLPFDIWMTLIPFEETRNYVRNVLMYSVIYSRKLGLTTDMLESYERDELL